MEKLGMSDARRSRLYIVGGAALIALGITVFMWIFFSDDVFPTGTITADRVDLWVIARLAAGASIVGGAWLLALAHQSPKRYQRVTDAGGTTPLSKLVSRVQPGCREGSAARRGP